MIYSVFHWVLASGIEFSLIAIVYIAFIGIAHKRIPAGWIYYVGLLLLAVPFLPVLLPYVKDTVNDLTVFPIGRSTADSYNRISSSAKSGTVAEALGILFKITAYVWFIGSTSVLAVNLIRHRRFVKSVKRWSEPPRKGIVADTLNGVLREMGIKKQMGIAFCPFVISPLLIGIHKPMIVLPQMEYDGDELSFIFRHECVHYKRKDLIFKYILLFITALQWFNPFFRVLAEAVALQCEISCDEQVIANYDMNQRRKYLESIVGILNKSSVKWKTPLSTMYFEGRKGMERRIQSVMEEDKKRAGIITALHIFFLLILMTVSALYLSRFPAINTSGSKSSIEMTSSSSTVAGFQKETSLYVDGNTGDISMDGKITVDGTASLRIVSDTDGSVVYSETFSSVKNETVRISLRNLKEYSSYTLIFSSDDAKTGKLHLESEESLTGTPEHSPQRPDRPDKPGSE